MAPPLRRTTTALGGLTLVGALFVASPAPAASPAANDYGRDAHAATNAARNHHDRQALRQHGCLQKYAVRQARKMAAEEEIWHQDLRRILRDCDVDYVGENVAAGFDSGKEVVQRGWMESDGHRDNILNRKFRRVEVAARKGDDGRWYAAQVFGRPD